MPKGRRAYTDDEVIAAFWAKVEKTEGCWLWKPSKSRDAYGTISIRGKAIPAHRLSYELAYTAALLPEFDICHTCDTPACVRPDHLVPGTALDNAADMKARGRSAKGDRNGTHTHPEKVGRGEAHYNAKITDAQIAEMCRDYATGAYTMYALASKYGINQSQVSRLIRGKRRATADRPC